MTMDYPENFIQPRDFASARLLRQKEPYHFQRWRASIHSNYPRPAQPNTFQPNAITRPRANNQRDYWDEVYNQYLARRRYRPLEQKL